MADLLDQLQARLSHDLGSEANRVRIVSVDAAAPVPGYCRIRGELAIDKVSAVIEATGPTPGTAYANFIGTVLERVEDLADLFDRANEECWVCGSRRERRSMEPELIGTDMWWLCDRCQRRRGNAAERNQTWPTEFEAWWAHWSALRRVEGMSDEAIGAILADADALYDRDPTVANRMQAVLRAAG